MDKDRAEKRGCGEKMSITKKKMKGPEWLFVYPLVVRTLGKQRERLSREINSVGVPVI